jgi:HMG-box domain/HMG (high mobility group) box
MGREVDFSFIWKVLMQKSMGKELAKRNRKKMRGENEPKKPSTEYFMFLRDERKNLEKGLSVKDQTRILSKRWAELEPERKKEYALEYAREIAIYRKKMEEYKKTDEYKKVCEKNLEIRKIAAKAKLRPRRKPSGYNLFVKEERAKMASEKRDGEVVPTFKEISQIISTRWHDLSENERNGYKARANAMNKGDELFESEGSEEESGKKEKENWKDGLKPSDEEDEEKDEGISAEE